MREFIGWFMVVITLLMAFVPTEVTGIDWGKWEQTAMWATLLIAGAIMTGGRK